MSANGNNAGWRVKTKKGSRPYTEANAARNAARELEATMTNVKPYTPKAKKAGKKGKKDEVLPYTFSTLVMEKQDDAEVMKGIEQDVQFIKIIFDTFYHL